VLIQGNTSKFIFQFSSLINGQRNRIDEKKTDLVSKFLKERIPCSSSVPYFIFTIFRGMFLMTQSSAR